MSKLLDIRNKRSREILGWLGGGLAFVIAGLWVAFVYFFPKNDGHGGVEASCGSAAQQGTMVGSTITVGGASSSANCLPKK